MKRLLAVIILVLSALGVAWAAEKFEDADLKISIEAPEGFIRTGEPLDDNDFLGKPKALFLSPDAAETAGAMLIHHMDIPGGIDYDTFKQVWPKQLKGAFGDTFEIVEQKDLKLGDREGFVLEFTAPGDGTKPDPNGDIPHHIRWRFIRDGDSKLVGLLFGAREEAWESFKAKYEASEKTLKATE